MSEVEVIKNVMLKEIIDGEFIIIEDVVCIVIWLVVFLLLVLSGQLVLVSYGWYM